LKAAEVMPAHKEEQLIRYETEEAGADRLSMEITFGLGVDFLKDSSGIPSIEGHMPSIGQDCESAMVLSETYAVILAISPLEESSSLRLA